MDRIFYRIVRDDPPTDADFKSHQAMGRPLRDPSLRRERAEGISVYDSLPCALHRIRATRAKIGRFVVPLAVPDGTSIDVRRTGNDPRHFTLYGSAPVLMALIAGPVVQSESLEG